jgi:hypothetical protein
MGRRKSPGFAFPAAAIASRGTLQTACKKPETMSGCSAELNNIGSIVKLHR